jgi:enoyl-CoA hydratase
VENQGLIVVERSRAGILLITLNRPRKLNALSKELLAELVDALDSAAADETVGCIVLTGAGKAFSAGADIDDMIRRGVRSYADPDRLQRWSVIERFPKPLVCAVNGYALGGGLELALLCDIIIAASTASFGCPEIKIGSFPGDGGTQRLPRVVGRLFATQMILTGGMVDAALAERKGLVSEVAEPERLLPRALEIAEAIAARSSVAARLAKEALRAADEMPLETGLKREHELAIASFETEDRVEGLRAFVEKRQPVFKGR